MPWTFSRQPLKLLDLLVPSLLTLQNLLHRIFSSLADSLLLLADVDDLVRKLECFCDNLCQCIFVKFCFFCQFEIVVRNPLLEDSRDLFEDLDEVFLKLRSQGIEQLLNFVFYFSAVYLFKVALDFIVDPMNDLFQLFHTLLELIEFSHDLLELYVNQILHKFLLHFLHRLLTCFDPHRRMNSSSFDLYFCFGL